jgi:uncharacterized membrane protein YvbJ
MSKFCKKCGKEIPQSSKKATCENCQYNKWGALRKGVETALGVVISVGSVAIFAITKGKSGGPKA